MVSFGCVQKIFLGAVVLDLKQLPIHIYIYIYIYNLQFILLVLTVLVHILFKEFSAFYPSKKRTILCFFFSNIYYACLRNLLKVNDVVVMQLKYICANRIRKVTEWSPKT